MLEQVKALLLMEIFTAAVRLPSLRKLAMVHFLLHREVEMVIQAVRVLPESSHESSSCEAQLIRLLVEATLPLVEVVLLLRH